MFGHHWEPGQATVVARRKIQPNPGIDLTYQWEYVLDVRPADGTSTFRATVMSSYNSEYIRFVDADIGEVVPVFCDVKRQKVKFDTSEIKAENRAFAKANREHWDAVKEGAPPDSATAPPSSSTPDVVVRGGSAEWHVTTDPAEIEQMRERIRKMAAQNPGSVAKFSAAPEGGGTADSLDQLEKLADLHARGALTDAEFAAEKAKILGSG